MKTITYEPNGEAIADDRAESRARTFLSDTRDGLCWSVSTGNVVDAVRALIAEGEFSCEDVMFRYKGQDIRVNEHGRVSSRPYGFAAGSDNFTHRILAQQVREASK